SSLYTHAARRDTERAGEPYGKMVATLAAHRSWELTMNAVLNEPVRPDTDNRVQMRLQNVHVEFKSRSLSILAVDDISLDVRNGEFVALVGPSGCGKSTALNMIAGLLKPSAGTVSYAGAPVAGPNTRVGYMTQKDTLLPWRTVEDNIAIAFELRARKAEAANARERVREMIELVGLAGFERHYPAELSGGMRKRAALARMVIAEPETLLLDEPFGALDAQVRLVMQQELLRLVELRKMTVVLVTHDLEEAGALADRVVVFTARPGRIRMMRDI